MDDSTTLDVIIIGAGISGLNTAYRLQTELPGCKYVILEARASIGGTWDLFRYPGIRSDTDLFTFGFPWRLWTEDKVIADGDSILNYLKSASDSEGISQHIRFHHNVLSANWSTEKQIWSVEVEAEGQTTKMYSNALVVGCGYYDYQNPLPATISGLENFKGPVIHPQFWPQDLDYADKRVVIIGSGATAITLLPSLAKKAAHVKMLQRSPTYIVSMHNNSDSSWVRRWLPSSWAFRILRLQFLFMPILLWIFCRWFPRAARQSIRKEAIQRLGTDFDVDTHFKPVYDPWDQRVCFAPDADFFEAIHSSKASVSTGIIKTMTPGSIQLESGEEISADIIVTATGLKLRLAGGVKISVDGKQIQLSEKFLWRNSFMQDVPNCVFVLGYTNASWTLAADTTALLFCRMLKTLHQKGLTSAVPRQVRKDVKALPYFNLKSTYVQRGNKDFPVTGTTGPWKGRTNYFLDLFKAKYGDLEEGMDYYKNALLVKRSN